MVEMPFNYGQEGAIGIISAYVAPAEGLRSRAFGLRQTDKLLHRPPLQLDYVKYLLYIYNLDRFSLFMVELEKK